MPNIITGSCVCEKVRYELTGSPITNIICHCDTCRKITGSVFMANSAYTRENFKIITGEDVLKVYDDKPPRLKKYDPPPLLLKLRLSGLYNLDRNPRI
ncbi:hypothetical protein N7481_000757 [Penicillium waksmanii]|uniref:uncharacterized protein n=1 Tax=Penicillium waksmanii TaxID=69791 RepID=UPI0025490182|nr:uncharacterized protein N7481_000757 [Penicillium waksmanii]KAJ6000348.1 hypothetical protein N7481_000757 [Penicillium waksmanii]